ncbi:alpha/beta fold hydrolase [Marinobacter sp. F4218]|uniref:alpha/beta fold hydrolase n=1 Tax=Marinobacter sp. F4218 TaxID=2862868 RepID=UPI001C62CA17|nr:alpha/beta hydrolase [Marinobacter sp. F4218]MBW7470713.1 alpha/beta hydrolase [Marinobacter sp. F4218]
MTAQFTTNTDAAKRLPEAPLAHRNGRVAAVGTALQWLHRVAPRTAGNIVENLFFSPQRLPLPIRYEYLLDEASSYTQLQYGAHTIPVFSWGDGPVVMMVHGWSGGGIQFGAFVKPLVKAGFRVVVFDAPAHGRAQGSQTNLYEMADVVFKVAASVGPVEAIIAHSIGSLAAARAVVDGVRAKHLIMLAPPRDLASVVAGFGATLGLSEALVSEQRRRMEQRFGPDVWRQFSFDDLAPELAPRGLVVIDRDDQSVPASHSDRVHLKWPGSEKLQTEGLGHYKLLWHPSVVERIYQRLATAG